MTAMPTRTSPNHARTADPPPRLVAALRAIERGWPVFPLHPYSKCPAVRDWEHRATCDPDQVTRWWANSAYNIGIPCQAAGLVLIDLDASRGQQPPPPWDQLGVTHGRDVLRILAEQAGQPDPIDTYTVATPGVINGEHRYFLAPADRELRNTTGQTSAGLGWKNITSPGGKNLQEEIEFLLNVARCPPSSPPTILRRSRDTHPRHHRPPFPGRPGRLRCQLPRPR